MEYIPRKISGAIESAISHYPVIVLTGPRQSGKTTLVNHLFPSFKMYSLEDPDIREIAKSDPRAFLADGSTGLIIDEVQRAPELLSYMQGIVDKKPTFKYVLTGSANFTLMKSVGQSLAGRAAIFELLPLAWDEIIANDNPGGEIDPIIYRGFYPSIFSRDIPPTLYYRNYTKTYIERDVRDLLNIKDLDKFQRFMRLCAARIGSVFVAKDIADDLGISSNTVKSWLSILQASYIVYLLPPFSENIGKRLVKSPKLYLTDTGLAAYLLGIESPRQINIDRMRVHLFENLVVMEALKKKYNEAREAHLYFFRDSNGKEIDLMARNGDKYRCFEIKSSSTFHSEFDKSLNDITARMPQRVSDTAVIYTGEESMLNKEPRLLNLGNFFEYL